MHYNLIKIDNTWLTPLHKSKITGNSSICNYDYFLPYIHELKLAMLVAIIIVKTDFCFPFQFILKGVASLEHNCVWFLPFN